MTVSPVVFKPDYALARLLLGDSFISPEEITVTHPDVVYGSKQLARLAATLPAETTLALLGGYGYGLMPRPPKKLSLVDIRATWPDRFRQNTGRWYEQEQFSKSDLTGGTGWPATRETPANGSTKKSMEEQDKLLTDTEYVPNAAEMSWFVATLFGVRGVRLFEKTFVRTSSLAAHDVRVYVGCFGPLQGIDIIGVWGNGRGVDLGLAPARRL